MLQELPRNCNFYKLKCFVFTENSGHTIHFPAISCTETGTAIRLEPRQFNVISQCVGWHWFSTKANFTCIWRLPSYIRTLRLPIHRMWCKIPCDPYSGCLHGGVGDTGEVTGVIKWAISITDVPLNQAANTSRSLNNKFWHGTTTTSIPPSHWSELQHSQRTGHTVSANTFLCISEFPGSVSTHTSAQRRYANGQ